MNDANLKVLTNVIGAVESGGQVYGQRRYDAYAAPYTNSSLEHTVTLGWAQNYGDEAYRLISLIYARDPKAFDQIDPNGKVKEMINGEHDWVKERWNPSTYQRYVLIALIDSPAGHICQDELFAQLMQTYIAECAKAYTSEVRAQMMYCEIRHLGGKSAADRIFRRCGGTYTLDRIMDALKADQTDKRSDNQAGDAKFWSRHLKCREFIERYAVPETAGAAGKKEDSMTLDEARREAKKMLYQSRLSTMTGYTPEGKECYQNAGEWTRTDPRPGDVIYFYSTAKARVGHTGIVERVDAAKKIVYTIEGNTQSDQYAENGGCVARHSYSYAATGGTHRVNGFGHPNFSAVGQTAEAFVSMAASWIGYLEKASNKSLDSKTANAGRNNYTRFQRDACGYVASEQWCQYFVDAMAIYLFLGTRGDGKSTSAKVDAPKASKPVKTPTQKPSGTTLHEEQQWIGECTADELNVRTWAGVENPTIKKWPLLEKGNRVGVCDSLKAKDGGMWYYIVIDNQMLPKPVHGFVSAKYIKRV